MVSLNKNILRTIIIASYLVIIALIISGISALFSYLNTGADRSTMLHTKIKKAKQYAPKLTWEPLNNEGRVMDNETLKSIQNDYLDAFYVMHMAYKTNTTDGIKDYFTDNARQNVYNLIELNTTKNITIESTTLNHNVTLDFFSEDGQLAVITDKDVVEYKRIFKAKKLVLETTEIATYKIVFLLEDGFWRIRHLVKEDVKDFKVETKTITTASLNIKGINYYPQVTPWNMFGDTFSKRYYFKRF